MVPPLQSPHFRSGLTLWTLVLLMPQAIPLALPLGLLVGVLIGLRNRPTTNRVRRAIVILGFIGSLAMFGTVGWLVPEANQAYRVDIARRLAIAGRANSGGDISRGIAETPLPSLREQALDLRRQGHPRKAQELIFGYHVRWSLSAAAFVFALFGFSLAALRLSRAGTIFAGTAPPLFYMTYLWELSAVDTAAFSGELVAIALAWLPNVMLILVSLALLSVRRDGADADPKPLTA
jgi:lipopolysaccharide export LptBFGC system permease protein LptF